MRRRWNKRVGQGTRQLCGLFRVGGAGTPEASLLKGTCPMTLCSSSVRVRIQCSRTRAEAGRQGIGPSRWLPPSTHEPTAPPSLGSTCIERAASRRAVRRRIDMQPRQLRQRLLSVRPRRAEGGGHQRGAKGPTAISLRLRASQVERGHALGSRRLCQGARGSVFICRRCRHTAAVPPPGPRSVRPPPHSKGRARS